MWQFTPIAWLFGIATLLSFSLAYRAWQMRPARGARELFALALSCAIWLLGAGLGFFNSVLAWKLVFLRVEYLGVLGTMFFCLLFILTYSHYERWINRYTVTALAVLPVIIFTLVLTVQQHNIFYRYFGLKPYGDMMLFDKVYGPGFWLHAAYCYIVLFLGAVILIQSVLRFPQLFRGQSTLLIVAFLIPWGPNILYVTGHNIFYPYDVAPLTFSVSMVLVFLSMRYYRFLSILPVAHDLVFKNISSGVMVIDRYNYIIDINPEAEHILMHTCDEVLGQPVFKIMPEYCDFLSGPHNAIETKIEIELAENSYELQIAPLSDRAGRPSGHVIILHDITQRKLTETALRDARDQINMLRMIEAELNQKLDLNFVLVMALDAAIRLSGADAALIGLAEGEKIRVAQVYGLYPPKLGFLPPGQGIAGRIMRRKKAELILDVQADPDYVADIPDMKAQIGIPLNSQEQFVGILVLETVDPTRFTEDVFDTLKLMAAQVAAAIDNAQMYEERQYLINDLDAYAHTVAHDLKNPLGLVMGYSEMLMSSLTTLPEATAQHYLEMISQGGSKMHTIINELLLLASVRRLEKIKTEPLAMPNIAHRALTRLPLVIEQAEAKIIFHEAESWPVALGYAAWVEEVWTNYISNAIKYGGSPPLVELGATAEEGGMIRFWVRDNGLGLDAEQQARLFNQFTRLDETRAQGHGLGLSIVQRIVDKLDGQVSVESTVGVGSTFSFTLPAVEVIPASETIPAGSQETIAN